MKETNGRIHRYQYCKFFTPSFILFTLVLFISSFSHAAQLLYADEFDAISSEVWSCEYTCPTAENSQAAFRLQAGIAPNNYGSWSKIRYKPQRFTSGSFKVRFKLSQRPNRAVWWGIALWDDGPAADISQFNEINFGYTSDQSFTNSQLYFESAKFGNAKSIKIDTGVDLYDGQYHEAELTYNADHVAFYFDGELMQTITDKSFIPTDPMDFILGPRLVTGSNPLTQDFLETIDWVEIADGFTPPPVTGAEVFQHCNYDGYSAILPVGNYNTAKLSSLGLKNNDLSSLLVPDGYQVTLYDADNLTGNSLVRTADDSCFVSAGFNDVTSSIKVEKIVVNNEMLSPAENSSYDANEGVPFTFTTNSDVAHILLYYGEDWVDFANIPAPFTYTWIPPVVGTQVVHYEFYDVNWDFISGGSRNIEITAASATLYLTTIAANDTLTSDVYINAIANDPSVGEADGDGIQRVTFELVKNGVVKASRIENIAPYDWYFDTTTVSNGSYSLLMTATGTTATGGEITSTSVPVMIAN